MTSAVHAVPWFGALDLTTALALSQRSHSVGILASLRALRINDAYPIVFRLNRSVRANGFAHTGFHVRSLRVSPEGFMFVAW
jgi:hypothetical protein